MEEWKEEKERMDAPDQLVAMTGLAIAIAST
jgi:hypothetical protein